MNFIEIITAFIIGWLACLLATINGYCIVKPYLDRRLLPAKKEKLPEPTQPLSL